MQRTYKTQNGPLPKHDPRNPTAHHAAMVERSRQGNFNRIFEVAVQRTDGSVAGVGAYLARYDSAGMLVAAYREAMARV